MSRPRTATPKHPPHDALKTVRVAADLSQGELAALVGATTSRISSYELGHVQLPDDTARLIESKLGLTEGALSEPSTTATLRGSKTRKPSRTKAKAKRTKALAGKTGAAKTDAQKPGSPAAAKVKPSKTRAATKEKPREAQKPVIGATSAANLSARLASVEEKLLQLAEEVADLAVDLERYDRLASAVRSLEG